MIHTSTRTFKWGVAPKPKQSAPFLDIEDILEQKRWEKHLLSIEDRQSIDDTIRFLKLVLIGQKIATHSAKNRSISGDLVAINAFLIANRSYQQNNNIDLKETTEKVISLLEKILDINEDRIQEVLSQNDLNLAFLYINRIGTVLLSRNSSAYEIE
jgi:tRNA uridine 5-carbamoylmethylation protein Kti12